MLTFLGKNWGSRATRYPDEAWAKWVGGVTAKGGAVTLDVGPGYGEAEAVGALADGQVRQLKAIVAALKR